MIRYQFSLLVLLCTFLNVSTSFGEEPKPVAETNESEKPKQQVVEKKHEFDGLSVDQIEIYQDGEIGTGRYIGGGVLGTLVGFGTGHIVISKYSSKGWIFTVSEFGSLAVMSAGIGTCVSAHDCRDGLGMALLGVVAFYGLRIWEIIDIWTLPSSHNSEYEAIKKKVESNRGNTARFFVLPTIANSQIDQSRNYGLNFGFQF